VESGSGEHKRWGVGRSGGPTHWVAPTHCAQWADGVGRAAHAVRARARRRLSACVIKSRLVGSQSLAFVPLAYTCLKRKVIDPN
jgi:hypothetical protein